MNNDFVKANCCEVITVHWATRLVCTAFKRELNFGERWNFPKPLTAEASAERLYAKYVCYDVVMSV